MSVISDENIWITGGGSGIGRALAIKLALEGNFVIISGRNMETLEVTRSFDPKRISVLPCDISDADSIPDIQKALYSITDSLDRIFLSAGTCEYVDSVEPLDIKLFERVFSVNVYGLINSINTALPFLKKAQHRGHIIALSSMATLAPFPRAEAYGASKAAVNYFMDSLSLDLYRLNIDVSNVMPGFVDTPLTRVNDFDMPFLMKPDEAASIIIKNVAKRKKQILFPRRLKWSLMIHSLFPALWSKLMIKQTKRRTAIETFRN